ncbi:hypothetical protein BH23GEM8_BH23GEM8_16200 [soil metagenome]
MSDLLPEVWLRGPVAGVSPLLQPVAHSLLQSREEVAAITNDFPEELLWERPGGVASVGFHLQHLTGVVERLLTYARGESLTNTQRSALAAEGHPGETAPALPDLLSAFHQQIDFALDQLRGTEEASLSEPREVGRAKLPSTVLGLLFHAAEHSQRHVGQLLVTVRVQQPTGDG